MNYRPDARRHGAEIFAGAVACAYNADREVRTVGVGARLRPDAVGPCITGIADVRARPQREDGVVIEEGSIPAGSPRACRSCSRLSGRLRVTSRAAWRPISAMPSASSRASCVALATARWAIPRRFW